MPYKKPFVMLIGFFCERLPYLLIGLVVLFFALERPTFSLVAVLAGIGLASSSAGLGTPPWLDMIASAARSQATTPSSSFLPSGLQLDGRGVGLLTAILVGTQAILNPARGVLADRVGHKTVLVAAAFS